MDLYEIVLENDDEVYAMSLVDMPAIETDFVFFNKQERVELKYTNLDKEQRLVAGPALIPDFKIYRQNQLTGEEFNIVFSKDTIKTLAHKFVSSKKSDAVTIMHQAVSPGIKMVESWLVEDSKADKSNKYGYELPEGTWFTIFKVENDDVWNNYVKTGQLRGFSIEGKLNKIKKIDMSKETKKSKLDQLIDLFTLAKEEDKNKVEAKEEEKEVEAKEDEKKVEAKEATEDKVKMAEVEIDGDFTGMLNLPEDFEEGKVEVEVDGKMFVVHVYEKTEEVEDPAETGEPANPQEAVVEELRAKVDKLAEFIMDSPEAVKLTRTEEGPATADEDVYSVENVMNRVRSRRK